MPIRLPSALTVGERTPPGAAAVLLNQEHSYTDLVMPIDATEKRMVDAIDGRRTIAEIRRQASAQGPAGGYVDAVDAAADPVRSLFERLWWFDQVVFDASATATS